MNKIIANNELKLFQMNFPDMGMPEDEPVIVQPKAKQLTLSQAVAAYCVECSVSPAACPRSDCKLWPHRPGNRTKTNKR